MVRGRLDGFLYQSSQDVDDCYSGMHYVSHNSGTQKLSVLRSRMGKILFGNSGWFSYVVRYFRYFVYMEAWL